MSAVHLICGPMFAGKTTTLLQLARVPGPQALLVKHAMDTRYSHDAIVTHDGHRLPCVAVTRLSDLDLSGVQRLFIDEAHFFTDLAAEIKDIAQRVPQITLAGLDRDYTGADFPSTSALHLMIPTLRCTILRATCAFCQQPHATLTRRRGGLPRHVHLIGGTSEYYAVCSSCLVSTPPPAFPL